MFDNLCMLQELYPANDDTKLRDLVDTCQMMGTVLEFQQQAMGILTTGKLSDMIVDSMKVGGMYSMNKLGNFLSLSGMTPWRNGSASDSRSEGCVFESRRGHYSFFLFSIFFS